MVFLWVILGFLAFGIAGTVMVFAAIVWIAFKTASTGHTTFMTNTRRITITQEEVK